MAGEFSSAFRNRLNIGSSCCFLDNSDRFTSRSSLLRKRDRFTARKAAKHFLSGTHELFEAITRMHQWRELGFRRNQRGDGERPLKECDVVTVSLVVVDADCVCGLRGRHGTEPAPQRQHVLIDMPASVIADLFVMFFLIWHCVVEQAIKRMLDMGWNRHRRSPFVWWDKKKGRRLRPPLGLVSRGGAGVPRRACIPARHRSLPGGS